MLFIFGPNELLCGRVDKQSTANPAAKVGRLLNITPKRKRARKGKDKDKGKGKEQLLGKPSTSSAAPCQHNVGNLADNGSAKEIANNRQWAQRAIGVKGPIPPTHFN